MPPSIDLSVIAAAHDEQDSVARVVEEIGCALQASGLDYETIVVDDGSTDGTAAVLTAMLKRDRRLRVLHMSDTPPGRGNGQSAAFCAGMGASRGRLIALLDADGQNDPADLPGMIELLELENADMVQGDRAERRDGLVRRVSSAVGRLSRRWLLGDTIRDTGCSLRVMRREVGLALPLELAGMHRFIPVTARQLGYRVVETKVRHRPRLAGRTKYGIGNRAIPGLIDCMGVRWMRSRRRSVAAHEVKASGPAAETSCLDKAEATA